MSEKSNEEFKVDFIGIGAPRCGTSWIAKCLAEHPEVCFSNVKETNFFDTDYNYENGISFYKKFFLNCNSSQIKGEFTPSYYLFEKTALRIKKNFPNIKLILVLRNPVDRIISDFEYHERRRGVKLDIDNILESRNRRIIFASDYYKYLSIFLKHFSINNVHIVVYEDIAINPLNEIKKTFSFLGIEDTFVPQALDKKINSSRDISLRFPWVNKFFEKRKTIKKYKVGRFFLSFIKKIGVNYIIKKILDFNLIRKETPSRVVLTKQQREKIENIYYKDIRELEFLLKVNLYEKWVNK